MRHLFTLVLSTLLCATLSAVPALKVRRSVPLADGSTIVVTLYGDEYHSWLLSDDGYVVEPTGDGNLYVKTAQTLEDAVATRNRISLKRAPRRIGSQATAPLPALGPVRVPVVLVNFTDSVFHVADTDEAIREYYDLFCNGTFDGLLYKGAGSFGSIRDYFVQQSDSLFFPEFTVYGPVTLSKAEKSYASNTTLLYTEAIRQATKQYSIDWREFNNRNINANQVDMVFVIFAGSGANYTGDRQNHVWPNERPIGNIAIDDTNTQYVNFVCSGCCCENIFGSTSNGATAVRPDGIGVMCHELSHALGLPDFYDTNYKAFGMDLWSLMDYGCYAANGFCPGAYTAYERAFMGWRALQELTENGEVTLLPMEQGGVGYKVVNDENPDEYYVLENRQRVGWDTGVFSSSYASTAGSGLQVTHVDYNGSRWNNNNVNTDAKHQRMTIIAANNRYIGTCQDTAEWADFKKTWSGNLFPFEENDSLTAYSTPAATVFTSSGFMNKDINAIRRQEDGSVTLYFGNDYVRWTMGDVNDDGQVDLTDAIMIVYYSLEVEQEGFIKEAADLNGDGGIDLTDAIIVVYKSLNIY